MYVGVDVGGTKVLLATLDDNGVILESRKFPTSQNYHHFLLELRHAAAFMEAKHFTAGGVGVPAIHFHRAEGRADRFSNLAWHNVSVQADLEKIFGCPFVMENDAKLAGLSEAMLLKDKYSRVLYVTISTGIGYGLTVDGVIDTNVGDAGGRAIMLEHNGKLVAWESFASGKAIVERYGKRAEDIHDDATWQAIARDLRLGFLELIAVMQPEVVVLGGSVGHYAERYKQFLVDELKAVESPLIKLPTFRKAKRPEEAVVYGCYDLAKATFSAGPARA